MIHAILNNDNTFDILGVDETESSISRSPTYVRLTYKDEQNRLITFEKIQPALTTKGSLLCVGQNGTLIPTMDRLSLSTVARLVAHPDSATETKNIQIGLLNKTLYLLPVEMI